MYNRVESYANTPAAFSALVVVAAIDSAFLPVPPFVLLIPMIIAAPHRWFRLTLWGTVASIGGSLLGYGIGAAMRGGLNLIHIDPNVRLDLGPDWLRKALLVLAALAAGVAVLSALGGLRQRSVARQRAAVAAALAVLLVLRPPAVWWALVLLASAAVVAAELFNTAIEHLADVLHPQQSPGVRVVKDCAAAGVLIAVLGALGVAAALAVHLLSGAR